MRSYELSCLSQRDGQSVFSTKKKEAKKKSNKNQITKIGKNVMNIAQFSIALHCCVQSLHLLHFKMEVACICIPKIVFILSYKCIDCSLYTNFPNLMSYLKFWMRDPRKESTSCFLIRLSPLVLILIGLFHKTQSPHFYLSLDSKSSLLSFKGLKVLAFTFHRTPSPNLYLS